MKTLISVAFLILVQFGCIKDKTDPPKQSTIDGLELTIIEPEGGHFLRAIYFIDNQKGFASGVDGALIKSTDGGLTWSEIETNTPVTLYGIDFIDDQIGFVVGGDDSCGESDCTPIGAVILKTTDGGDTWEEVALNLEDKIELKSVYFTDASTGFAVGHSSILTTHDGGNTWAHTKIENLGGIMQKIDFNGTQNGMIICTNGKILSTTDGGDSWGINATISALGSASIFLTEDNIAYASGSSKVFKSIDFGSTWVELTNAPEDNFDLNFINKDIGFAVGRGDYSGGDWGHNYGSLFYTIDGGNHWIGDDSIEETDMLYESSFPSENLGYIVSQSKIIKVKRN